MQDADGGRVLPCELISVCVAERYFCVDIMAVREIRGWTPATPLPHAPPAFQGVVNLRGSILPIMDLRVLLGMSAGEPGKQHVIIVVEAHKQTVGMMVDAVNDILTITPDMVQPPPQQVATGVDTPVEGLVEIDGRLLTLLRIDRLISPPQARAA